MGKIIAIEAIDGAGKELQSKMLVEFLKKQGFNSKRINYPNYENKSSTLVKMYLNGEFGKNPQEISPYIASVLFSCDRYGTFMTEWKKNYENGDIIVCDRYVSSNLIHQAQKYEDENLRNEYVNWLNNFEYNIMQLPKPDITIYLDIDFEISKKNIETRKKDNKKIDIHENNIKHLENSYKISKYFCKKYNWIDIKCSKNGEFLDKNLIHQKIIEKLKKNKII